MAITKKDVETLKEVFATKKDLEALKEVFVTKIEFKELESKVDKLERKVDAGFDRLLTGQDKLMCELEKAREDRIFAFAKDREQDSRLDNMDVRVKKLEAIQA